MPEGACKSEVTPGDSRTCCCAGVVIVLRVFTAGVQSLWRSPEPRDAMTNSPAYSRFPATVSTLPLKLGKRDDAFRSSTCLLIHGSLRRNHLSHWLGPDNIRKQIEGTGDRDATSHIHCHCISGPISAQLLQEPGLDFPKHEEKLRVDE